VPRAVSAGAGDTPRGEQGGGIGLSPAVPAQVAQLQSALTSGLSGVRREITAVRKELAVTNSSVRLLTKKTDDIAVATDAMGASVVMMRQAISKMGDALSEGLAPAASARREAARAPPGDAVHAAGADPPVAGSGGAAQPQTEDEMEIQDAKWVLTLKVRAADVPEECAAGAPASWGIVDWAFCLDWELFGVLLWHCP